MKTLIRNKLTVNASIKAILLCLIIICCFKTTKAQLSKYIVNQDSVQTIYDIKQGMDLYMDSLSLVQDSSVFYAEGGEYSEYMRFLDYWEPRLIPHGNFNYLFNADYNYYYQTMNNYQDISAQPWHEIGPFDRPGGSSDGVGPVEYLSIFDNGTTASTQYMLVASLLGGVFYSDDFGETWNSTSTDTQWEKSGSGCAIFHPQLGVVCNYDVLSNPSTSTKFSKANIQL